MREAAPQPLSSSVPPSPDWRARPAEPGVDPRLGAFPSEPEEAFEAERSDAEALTGADAAQALEMLLDRTRRGPTVAEVHVPFCETKCEGCGCWQNEYRQLESSRYADAVVKEMAVWSGTHAQSGAPVQALRLGGGNPTALEAVDILRILSSARRLLPLANDCEVVLEARVHHFTEEKMEAALAGGVTRFELPVRSFNTAVRRAVGRVEEGFEAARLLERLAQYDEAGVAVELDYGLPGQTLDAWESDLRTASSLPLDGLTVRAAGEPDFPGARVKTKRAAGEKLLVESHRRACSLLADEGWDRRTSVRWGRSERDRSLFEALSIGDADRLVFGSGAEGRLFGWTYRIEGALEGWFSAVWNGRRSVAEVSRPEPAWRAAALLVRGIFEGRFSVKGVERRSGLVLAPVLEPLITQWRAAGLVTGGADWVRLTDAGCFHHARLERAAHDYVNVRAAQLLELPALALRSRGAFPIMAEDAWRAVEAGFEMFPVSAS